MCCKEERRRAQEAQPLWRCHRCGGPMAVIERPYRCSPNSLPVSRLGGDWQPHIGDKARQRRDTSDCLLWVRTAKPTGNRVVYSASQSEIASGYGEAGHETQSRRRLQSSSTTTRPSSEPSRAVQASTRRLERKTVGLVWQNTNPGLANSSRAVPGIPMVRSASAPFRRLMRCTIPT